MEIIILLLAIGIVLGVIGLLLTKRLIVLKDVNLNFWVNIYWVEEKK